MRRTLALVLAASALFAAPAPAAASAASKAPKCFPSGSKTIKATSKARVFRRGDRVYACRFSRNFAFRLATQGRPEDQIYNRITITGGYLAYSVWNACDACQSRYDHVYLHDLDTGRAVVSAKSATTVDDDEHQAFVEALVIGDGGRLAWVGLADSVQQVLTAKGKVPEPTLLDQGTTIPLRSLKLSGLKLTWSNAGQTKEAILK